MHFSARLAVAVALVTRALHAQPVPAGAVPLTRAAAVQTALGRTGRLGVAQADSASADAQLRIARERPNPSLTLQYTKDVPRYHVLADIPFDGPWLRGPRVRAAELGRTAAGYRLAGVRAAIALDVDTTYTRALAARARAELSRRTAIDADSLRRLAVLRRDAGDASDLDVELATVNAGQQANTAAADSLAVFDVLLDLQAAIGMQSSDVAVVPTDSLDLDAAGAAPPPSNAVVAGAAGASAASGSLVSVAAAEAALAAAQVGPRLARRSVFAAPSLTLGIDTFDPTTHDKSLLPLVGVGLPLPLFNRNRGAIAAAEAEQSRASAELEVARVESRTLVTRATRQRDMALARVRRDQALVTSANRVATLSLTAYREGASTLPSVLEAQRNAREVLAQYIEDVAATLVASATLRTATLTVAAPTAP